MDRSVSLRLATCARRRSKAGRQLVEAARPLQRGVRCVEVGSSERVSDRVERRRELVEKWAGAAARQSQRIGGEDQGVEDDRDAATDQGVNEPAALQPGARRLD